MRPALAPQEAEHEVLCADVGVSDTDRLVLREGEHTLRPAVEAIERPSLRPRGPRALVAERGGQSRAHHLERDADGLEDPGGHALALDDETEEQVFGPHVALLAPLGLRDR